VTTRAIALVLLVTASLLVAVVLRRRDGRSRVVTDASTLSGEDLGAPLGAAATFVQFSGATCAPCRPVRRTLAELAATRPDVVHIDLDAEERLDLVRRHRVLATPTVLLLDATGQVRRRLTGAVDRARVLEELAAVVASSPERVQARVQHG